MAKSYAPTNVTPKPATIKPTKRKDNSGVFSNVSLPFGKTAKSAADTCEDITITRPQKKIVPVVKEERKRGAFGYSRLRAKDLEDPRTDVKPRDTLKTMISEVAPREHVAWALCGLFASVFGFLICYLANKGQGVVRTFMVDVACGAVVSVLFWTVTYCLFISVIVNALLGFPSA